jgi:hypothetical protein
VDDRAREHALLRVVAVWQSCNELEKGVRHEKG